MLVTFLFDTEDFITPVGDDAARDVAQMMSRVGLPGTFLVVGEKARRMARLGRRDTIEALRRHGIGLHTDRHSIHPTVSEYLEEKGWKDGVDEVVRREGPGVAAIEETFGVAPSVWGHAGGSYAPQLHAGVRALGITAIIYPYTRTATADVHYYTGQLTYSDHAMVFGPDRLASDDETAEVRMQALRQRVLSDRRAGVPWLAVFTCHPIILRVQEFPDALNFIHGKETPPDAYQQPPLRSEEAYRTALKNTERAVRWVAEQPGIEVRTLRELNRRFGAPPPEISAETLRESASRIADADGIFTEDPHLSPAEAVDVLAAALVAEANGHPLEHVTRRDVLGPCEMPLETPQVSSVAWERFIAACRAVGRQVDERGSVPPVVSVGDGQVGLGIFYRALAEMFVRSRGGAHPLRVTFQAAPPLPAISQAIAEDTRKALKWRIHKPDLNPEKIVRLTVLQTWTLRPAIELEGSS